MGALLLIAAGLTLILAGIVDVFFTVLHPDGFGDITPSSGVYQFLAVSEALIDFGILTLAVSYVIGVYEVLQRLGVLAAGLLHQARDTAEPLSILAPHFPDGEPRELNPQVMGLHRSLVEVYKDCAATPSSTTTTAAAPTAPSPTRSA